MAYLVESEKKQLWCPKAKRNFLAGPGGPRDLVGRLEDELVSPET